MAIGGEGIDVLVTGVGEVGSWAIELLARSHGLRSLVAVDIDGDRGEALVRRAAIGAAQQGYAPRLEFRRVNLRDLDSLCELLDDLAPRVILHAASLLPVRRMATELPQAIFGRLREAGFGPWLPVHMLLTHRLMTAVALTDRSVPVINLPFPDFVNPLLGAIGLAPTAGAGNVANVAGELRWAVAEKHDCDSSDVHVAVVASHAVAENFQRTYSSGGVPYYARISVAGRNVTDEWDVEGALATSSAKLAGVALDARVAASAVESALAFAFGRTLYTHAAGPLGLPGGYPVWLRRDRVELALPDDLTLEQAITINTAGLRRGGIERIDADGTVIFTENATATLDELTGYHASTLSPSELEDRADMLLESYRELVQRCDQEV